MALQILRNNQVHLYVFAEAFRSLLVKVRGKRRNLMVIGCASCGKTLRFLPLSKLCNVPLNRDKYAYLEVSEPEIIFLNEFRLPKEAIAWKEMLLLLECQPVHFPAPKNNYAKDL